MKNLKQKLKTKKIGEVCNIKYGKMPKKEDIIDTDGYPIFTGYLISGYHREYMYDDSEIIIVARGVGGAGDIRMSPPKAWITNIAIILEVKDKEVDKQYLFWKLKSNTLRGLRTGSAQPQIIIADAKEYSIDFPPIHIQKNIANTLSAYDDLIENNTRRIKILEEMAQAIYREWFVNFRAPGVKLRKTTPEEKKAIGKDVIPEGWEVVKIGDLLEKIPRRKKIKKQEYQEKGKYPVVDQGREFVGGYTNEVAAVNDNPLPVIVFGDHTRIVKYIDFPFACGADGTQLLYPNNKRMPITLFYYAINHIDLKDYAYSRHFKFLKEKTTLLPDEFISNEFNSIVEPIREKIRILRTQINNLRQTRDLLLPKLVSGEVEV